MPTSMASPVLEMATMVESLLAQVSCSSVSGWPALSFATTDSCIEVPSTPRTDGEVRMMVATAGGVTVPVPKTFEDGPVR